MRVRSSRFEYIENSQHNKKSEDRRTIKGAKRGEIILYQSDINRIKLKQCCKPKIIDLMNELVISKQRGYKILMSSILAHQRRPLGYVTKIKNKQ